MTKKFKSKYGYQGWQEFLTNREELIQEFQNALAKNENRPVRTSHGNAGEAAVRKFFENFLPKKYGITSGYIIPDIICQDYILFHYDIIIYDNINSPILWIDSDYDDSNLGRKRAIPAEYVFSVIEVKSMFTKKSIREATEKLSDLNSLKDYLPKEFTCSTFFFEIKNDLISKSNILEEFLSKQISGFKGGVILTSEINTEMTGLISPINIDETQELNDRENKNLVRDIDEIDIFKNEKGYVQIKGGGGRLYEGRDKKLHFNRVHFSPIFNKGRNGIHLSWSYNNFSQYIINLLGSLEGKDIMSSKLPIFGQVFDVIQRKKAPLQKDEKQNGKPFLKIKLYDGVEIDKQNKITQDGSESHLKFTIIVQNCGDRDVIISDDSFKNELKVPKGKAAFKIASYGSKESIKFLEDKKIQFPYRLVYYDEEFKDDFIAIEKDFIIENGDLKML